MKLHLPIDKIKKAQSNAKKIVKPVQEFVKSHTTVTVERATLRLLGADLADKNGVPVPNILVETMKDKLKEGLAKYYINALIKENLTQNELNKKIAEGFDISKLELTDMSKIEAKAQEIINGLSDRVTKNVKFRNEKLNQYKENIKSPMLYLIVATGNIYEDVKQAKAAAKQGADIIAVIRTTAQSLLDYVPYGATTEGFGGTYATQENFRIMRAALDEVCEEEKRYIRLVNYCSGLCMPEIAAMGALERLDMMLNDSMYGILFRDINMYRTFVDQNFSRMINSFAEIIINTGEDNYLTTSDAFESAHTVLASQMINLEFAKNAGMPEHLVGLGHAFEMDPEIKDGFLYQLAEAQMTREIFPNCPLKYMPPTKFMTGNIFKGYAMNTLYNFVSKATNQSIHLLGMLTEAIHTPFMQDRYLALDNALYVMNNMNSFMEEVEFKKDGKIVKRAHDVVEKTETFLEEIEKKGLFDTIEQGLFAEVKRPKNGGKGFDGVYEKSNSYYNPVEKFLKSHLKIEN